MEFENITNFTSPLISVVIPTYNRQRSLGRALNSVLNQTYKNIEVVVVDDASTDQTEFFIESINDPRLKYIRLETNQGANHARNLGITESKGDFIAFQDSDDEWLSEKLDKQIELITSSDTNLNVVFCSYVRVKGSVATYLPKRVELSRKGNMLQRLLQGNFITTQSLLVKSKVFKEIGFFDENMKRLQDWELILRIANRYEIGFLDMPLLVTHFSEGSITSKPYLLPEAFLYIYKKHNQLIEAQNLRDTFCIQIAKSYINAEMILEAFAWHWTAIKLKPWRVRWYLSFLFSLFGKRGINLENRISRFHQTYLCKLTHG